MMKVPNHAWGMERLASAMVLLCLCELTACAATTKEVAPPAPAADFAFVHASVLTMESQEEVLPDQTVLIHDGHIARVGPSNVVPVPAGIPVEDCTGRFLVPGLADLHVHLAWEPESWLPLYLINGVTTVLNMSGSPSLLVLREAVRRGEVVGPTLYTTGPFTNQPEIMTADEAERAVVAQKAAGYDAVKLHGDLTDEAFVRLVAAARKHDIGVTGHAPRNLGFDAVFKAGMHSIAHAEEMLYTQFGSNGRQDYAAIAPFAKRAGDHGLWLSPTLATYAALVRQWGMPEVARREIAASPWKPYLHPEILSAWDLGNSWTVRKPDPVGMENNLAFQRVLVKSLSDAGVRLIVGTDSPLPLLVPGSSLHEELAQLRAIGLSNWDVLAAATRSAGAFAQDILGEKEQFGVIAEGARADVVVVRGNPVDDLATLATPLGVMTRGRWHTHAALTSRLEEVAKRYATVAPVHITATEANELRRYEGTFEMSSTRFAVSLAVKGNQLLLSLLGTPYVLPLVATGKGEFRLRGYPARLVFSEAVDSVTVFDAYADPRVLVRK
jgi:imidazolonepropionase-like amidohydrolase